MLPTDTPGGLRACAEAFDLHDSAGSVSSWFFITLSVYFSKCFYLQKCPWLKPDNSFSLLCGEPIPSQVTSKALSLIQTSSPYLGRSYLNVCFVYGHLDSLYLMLYIPKLWFSHLNVTLNPLCQCPMTIPDTSSSSSVLHSGLVGLPSELFFESLCNGHLSPELPKSSPHCFPYLWSCPLLHCN